MAGVSVTVSQSALKNASTDIKNLVGERFAECADDIGEIFIEICTPFVPYDSGELINSGHVVSGGKDELQVAWNKSKKGKDIARMMYYDSPRHWNHEGRRTDHWDQAAMEYEGDTFMNRVEKELLG